MLTENDVVQAVARYLSENGFRIESALTTKKRGIDIVAINLTTGRRMLVEAKGGTSSKDGSARYGIGFSFDQAKTHVAVALYCAAKLRQLHSPKGDEVALAFPDDPNHRLLIEKISTALQALNIIIFFVSQERTVSKCTHCTPTTG